jgi:hypothetical protein
VVNKRGASGGGVILAVEVDDAGKHSRNKDNDNNDEEH